MLDRLKSVTNFRREKKRWHEEGERSGLGVGGKDHIKRGRKEIWGQF